MKRAGIFAMDRLHRIFNLIDKMNQKIGEVFCFAILAIMLIQVMDVIMRYVFNSPTSWAWDVNRQLFSASAMLAGSYALLHDIHVRLDIFSRNFSDQKKQLLELLSFPFIFLALCFVFWQGLDMVWWSWKTDEHAHSYLAPILWPVKSFLPLAAVTLMLQAVSKYGRILLSFLSVRNPGNSREK